jgi:transcriptional regulator GlxA family with amidase domain
LRTSTPSVKEIAYELGYSWQHDLARAYHKYGGASPGELKMHAKASGEEQF